MERIVAADGKGLYLRKWVVQQPRANILLAHGMTEHSGRFDHFGRFLNEQQISLYCHDQRGHGQTALEDNTLGHLRQELDWSMMVSDLTTVYHAIRQDDGQPVFLMGHSMGSFLSRCAVQMHPHLFDGLILSGTGGDRGVMGQAGLYLAKLGCVFGGEQGMAQTLQKLTFGAFNRTFKQPRTEFDWLSRDPEQVDLYLADELCGFMCTNGFYHELFQGMIRANDLLQMAPMHKHMPVYFFSGDQDPVGNCGKGVLESYEKFKKLGMKNVTCKLYPDGRHEMLNEINQLEVYADLYHWLDQQLQDL